MPVQSPGAYAGPASILRAARGKKLAYQLGARLRFNPALHIHPVIQPRMPHDVPHRPAHPRLLIERPKHKRFDLGQYDRSRALRARLDRHVKRAIGEPIGI